MFGLAIGAVILLLVLPAQLRARPVAARQLVILPIVATLVGVAVLAIERPSATPGHTWYLAAEVVFAGVAGALRGLVVRIEDRRGFAVRTGGWGLAAAWIATITGRVLIDLVAVEISDRSAVFATFPVFLGLTLGAQNAVLAARMRQRGLRVVPIEVVSRVRERRHQHRKLHS